MITKQRIQYSPLIHLKVKCIIQNAIIEGRVLFESQQVLEIQTSDEKGSNNLIRKVLKSSLKKFEVFDEKKNQFIEVDYILIRGDLTNRLKKMK
ncbi:MAG: hypothetical protein ACMXYB_03290 [Candidatus Woesearchaeota archaeon]